MHASPEIVASHKDTFLEAAGHDAYRALTILYDYMFLDGTCSDNIPKTAMEYTNFNRKEVQKLLKGMLNLITQGVKIRLSYVKLRYNKATYDHEEDKWEKKLKKLVDHIKLVDKKVKDKWTTQHEKDALAVAVDNRGKSNVKVANAIYVMLTKKYDWQRWMVVVYDSSPKNEVNKHKVIYCGGFAKYEHHGKNIVVASKLSYLPTLDEWAVSQTMSKIQIKKLVCDRYQFDFEACHYAKLNAQQIFNKLPYNIKHPSCTPMSFTYRGSGVILTSLNPAYKGKDHHFAVVTREHVKIHAFA